MILSMTSLRGTVGRIANVMPNLKQRPDFTFIRDPEFRAAFRHGLAIASGGVIGLLIWAAVQGPAPSPYRDYVVTSEFRLPSDELGPAPAEPEVAAPDKHNESVTYTDHRPEDAPNKATVPTPGLTENKKPYGDLPIIRAGDKLRPFDAYRQPFAADQLNKPLIAVVMLDYGLSTDASGSILGVMPTEVNVALSPAARNTKDWAQKAFDHGHELWLELAVEPQGYPNVDPGANALLTTAPVERNQAALYTQLGNAVGYAGIIGRGESPYYSSGADADFMAGQVFERGLGVVLNTTHADKILKLEAEKTKAPYYAGAFVTTDAVLNAEAMAAAFAKAESNAKEKGFAIAVFRPSAFARKAVLEWVSTLKTKGLVLAPLSVIAERGTGLAP